LEKEVKNYTVIRKKKGKYVVYDDEGKVVVVTTSKDVLNEFSEDK
tara:strand:+ start:586 stop:720 length:135 start_codon:yes stop_codon:yes gene_type:complete